MEIRNVMEDLVARVVDEVARDAADGMCTSAACRADIVCFVLNRVPPHYVSSARGRAHAEKGLAENSQMMVDLVTLAHEGIRRVTTTQRPYYTEGSFPLPVSGPAFNFPAIKGRLLSATTFAPLAEGNVRLLRDGQEVAMLDPRWQNPFPLNPTIAGTFLFSPRPIPADKAGIAFGFELEVALSHPAFEDFHHFFCLDLKAADEADFLSKTTPDYRLPDLFVPPR